jgi:hypothetical protein
MDNDEVVYDMEADIKSCPWMVEKVRGDSVYAQNLYAALCNNDFQRLEMWPILKGKTWHCSWRYAGGLVADVQGRGDYMDWYCSGIQFSNDEERRTPEEWANLTAEQQKYIKDSEAFATEGTVADEIANDLYRLGWRVLEQQEE